MVRASIVKQISNLTLDVTGLTTVLELVLMFYLEEAEKRLFTVEEGGYDNINIYGVEMKVLTDLDYR